MMSQLCVRAVLLLSFPFACRNPLLSDCEHYTKNRAEFIFKRDLSPREFEEAVDRCNRSITVKAPGLPRRKKSIICQSQADSKTEFGKCPVEGIMEDAIFDDFQERLTSYFSKYRGFPEGYALHGNSLEACEFHKQRWNHGVWKQLGLDEFDPPPDTELIRSTMACFEYRGSRHEATITSRSVFETVSSHRLEASIGSDGKPAFTLTTTPYEY